MSLRSINGMPACRHPLFQIEWFRPTLSGRCEAMGADFGLDTQPHYPLSRASGRGPGRGP